MSSVDEAIQSKFKYRKYGNTQSRTPELGMSERGLNKMFDRVYNTQARIF